MWFCEEELIWVLFSASVHELTGDNTVKMIKVSVHDMALWRTKIAYFINIESVDYD